jgi:membrane-associated protein
VSWLDGLLGWFGSVIGGLNDLITSTLIWLLEVVRQVDPAVRVLIAAGGMFLETTLFVGLIVPGDTIVIVAATAVTSPGDYVALLVGVIAGSLAGESLGFALGRWFGHGIRRSRLGRRLGERNWERAERYVRRRGGPAVFVSRFLPVLHALVPVTAGAGEMRYRRFIAWTAPACTLWAALYVTIGSLAAGSIRELAGEIHVIGYVFAGSVVLFLVAAFLVRRVVERSQRRHWGDDPTPDTTEAGER